MIDASLRASIVNLLRDLRDRLGVSIIYITTISPPPTTSAIASWIMRMAASSKAANRARRARQSAASLFQLLKPIVLSPTCRRAPARA